MGSTEYIWVIYIPFFITGVEVIIYQEGEISPSHQEISLITYP